MKKIKRNPKFMNSTTKKYGALIIVALLILSAGIWTYQKNNQRQSNTQYKQTFNNLKFVTLSGQALATKGEVEGTIEVRGAVEPVLGVVNSDPLSPWSGRYSISNIAVPKGKKTTLGVRLISDACGPSGITNVEVGADQTEVKVANILDSSWCTGASETE